MYILLGIPYIFTQLDVYVVGHTVYFPPTPLLLPLASFFDDNPSSPSSTFAFLFVLCPLRIHHKQLALLINVLNSKKKKKAKKKYTLYSSFDLETGGGQFKKDVDLRLATRVAEEFALGELEVLDCPCFPAGFSEIQKKM